MFNDVYGIMDTNKKATWEVEGRSITKGFGSGPSKGFEGDITSRYVS